MTIFPLMNNQRGVYLSCFSPVLSASCKCYPTVVSEYLTVCVWSEIEFFCSFVHTNI